MGVLTSIGMFVVIWWVILFTTLPLWVKPHDQLDDNFGTAGSAPQKTHLLKKAVLTTVIAFFVWLAVYILVETGKIEEWLL